VIVWREAILVSGLGQPGAENNRRLIGTLAGEKRWFNQNLRDFPAITRRNNLV
jgi:hypothetical protein